MHTPTVGFDSGEVEEEEEEVARVSDTVQPPDPLWPACDNLVFLQEGEEGDEEGFEDNDLDLEEFEVRAVLRQIWLGKSHPLESRV